jgi:soluble lytic murein transglycosylase-like protein
MSVYAANCSPAQLLIKLAGHFRLHLVLGHAAAAILARDLRRSHRPMGRIRVFPASSHLKTQMFDAIPRSRALCRQLPLLVVAAFAQASAAQAQIAMLDGGTDGIVFSNRDIADAPAALENLTATGRSAFAPAPTGAARLRREKLAPLVAAAAKTHGLPEALLQAVIEVESNFNSGAVSAKGAVGLMQLMPQTARQLGVTDARDPAANIDGGARYLKELLGRFGNDLPLALAAYNAGPAAVQRRGAIPQFSETQRYVPRVLVRYHGIQSGSAM